MNMHTWARCLPTLILCVLSSPASADDLVAALSIVRAREKARIETIASVERSVTALFARGGSGGGSGVIIDPEGYGLTNFHVVAAMLPDRVGEAGLSDHREYECEVLGLDPTGDVAMFKLRGAKPFAVSPLGDSDTLHVGDETFALGNPFLLAEDFTPTITFGIVSGLHRYQGGAGKALVYTDCIQVDTSINPGNSGGPLFDMSGRLVGINGRVSIEERGRVNVGVGYAITINQIRRFIPALRAGLVVHHAAAGFTVAERTGKVFVDRILEDSAAWRAGLRSEDRLVRMDGRPLTSANQFISVLGTYPAGWPIELVAERGGKTLRWSFRLDEMPLPSAKRPPGMADPFAENEKTAAANRRAVRRAWRLYRRAVAGSVSPAEVQSISFTGRRSQPQRPGDPPSDVHWTESRGQPPAGPVAGAEAERLIRWSLLTPPRDSTEEAERVVGADEVRGRVCVVIERDSIPADQEGGKAIELAHRLTLDDEDGRLVAIDFSDPVSGKKVRYEYDDDRRSGALRYPHRRWLFLDGAPYADETFERIEVAGKGA